MPCVFALLILVAWSSVSAHLRRSFRPSTFRRSEAGRMFLSDRACHASCVHCGHGQREVESGTGTDIVRGPYPSPVSFDYRTADRKPHAHATGLGGVERVEQTVKILYVKSRPRILYGDEHARRRLPGADK